MMKTSTILKMMALPVAVAMSMITISCSNDDNVEQQPAPSKGYAFPVTIDVTRAADNATTRASYSSDTKKLSFSEGDKLFVGGYYDTSKQFAGTLDYSTTTGKFSGTIYTEAEYTGSVADLLSGTAKKTTGITGHTPDEVGAVLLPKDYLIRGYLTGATNEEFIGVYKADDGEFTAFIDYDETKAFVTASTADATKKLAVEQLSGEYAESYTDSKFALKPASAIVVFTIEDSSLSGEQTVSIKGINSDTSDSGIEISDQKVTFNDNKAYFAIGIPLFVNNWTWKFKVTIGSTAYKTPSYGDSDDSVNGTTGKSLSAGKVMSVTLQKQQ